MDEYGIPIEITEYFNPPDINVSLYISKALTEQQEKRIQDLILTWYDVGLYGGYDDCQLHYLGDIVFDEENVIYISVDFGDSTDKPLDVLIKILKKALEYEGVEITKIELE